MKIESAVFETSVGDGSQLFPSTLPEVVFSGGPMSASPP